MSEPSTSSITKRTAGLFLMATAASFFAPTASAFVPLSMPQTTTTALHLKSGQGNQLVAAYNAANSLKKADGEEEENDDVAVILKQKEEAAPANPEARSLAARLFSLDFHRKNKDGKDDVVYYPLVGFKLVHHEGRVIPLPTKGHAACRLPTVAQKDEEVFGWYSPSCSLDLYAEDVCHEPLIEQNAEETS